MRLKIQGTAKTRDEYHNLEWKKQARISLYHYRLKENRIEM